LAGLIGDGDRAIGSGAGLGEAAGASARKAGTSVGTGLAGDGATDASSSAMICRMDERISSIDGSLGAGLFMEASL
jgi:hypothetical protein